METPEGLRTPPAYGRDRSLDRSLAARKASESWNCQCLSLPTSSCRRALRRTASDGARSSVSPAQPAEAQGALATALMLEGTREFLPNEPKHPEDAKKDKAQRQAQQGWLKTLLNFLLLRMGPEEPKEKTGKRPQGKDEPLEPPQSAEGPVPKKKGRDKKVGCKKQSHRKLGVGEAKEAQDLEAGGQEARLPGGAVASNSEEADPDLAGREEAVIQMIVEFLKKAGDQWDQEKLHAPQPEVTPQNPAVAFRRKSLEKKPSLKRAFSPKKPHPEEPWRAGLAKASSPEAQLPSGPSFLPLGIGGYQPSISGLEEPGVHEVLSTDGGGPSPREPSSQAGCQGPAEELPPDGASESKEFLQKILALLQDTEEQKREQQPQVLGAEVAVENLAPPCRRKSPEKKSSLRRAFSHKKHGSKEPKRGGTVGATGAASPSPEARPPKRPSFLPLCVGGHRPSVSSLDAGGLEFQEPSAAGGRPVGSSEVPSQARSCTPEEGPQPEGAGESRDLIIHKLVALLQEVDGELGKQIQQHPSFKGIFYKFSDASLQKLVATLRRQKTSSSDAHGSLAERPAPFAFSLVNRFAGDHSGAICSLLGSRGRYGQHCYAQLTAHQPNITSPESQSPD